MTTTTIDFPGIALRKQPCWILVDRKTGDPRPEWGTVLHFDHKVDAQDAIDEASSTGDGGVDARQLDTPCFGVTPACGEGFESDGMLLCFSTVEEAITNLEAAGWEVVDGRLCCEDCGQACGL